MNKQSILISFFICIININSFAKEMTQNETKTYTVNWKDPLDGKILSKCAPITVDLHKWAIAHYTYITIHRKFTKNKAYPYISNSDFTLYCNTQNINMNDQGIFYNKQTKQWDLPSKDKNELVNITVNDNDGNYPTKKRQLYQLNTKNADGWLYTEIINTSFDNPQMSSGIKHAWFCLVNNNKTQQVCGDGEVQDIIVIHGKPEFNKGDYTPYLIQVLETIKFTDNK